VVAQLSGTREQPLGVSEVVRLAARTVDGLGLLWVEGEVTQASKPGSGHIYFALRGRECILAAVMWGRDAQRLTFAIAAGQRLRVRGRLGVYDRDGKMQLYADFVEPAGLGSDALAREQLKAKLAAEGIFAVARKRPLPAFPRRIGVVTSAKGAAVHDIIQTVHRRLPTPILIADAAVQGPTAPAQLVNGMAMVVRAGIDVLIIGRGGGAATDLSAFDHERVVRTIARCPVPVVSAVGHEVDLSLADLAADARASTPTAAAELCVPDRVVLAEVLGKERRRLDRELRHLIGRANQDLDRLALRLTAAHPGARLAQRRAELDALAVRAAAAMRRRLHQRRGELANLAGKLDALSPLAVLERGYAVVLRDGHVVRDAGETAAGERLRVRLARGAIDVRVDDTGPDEGRE
jgi:exodeoxyribonuclease VII large subunit